MGNNAADKSSKEGKEAKEPKTPASQEQNSAASGVVTPDWSGFQAYSPMPPHGFLASSPQAHPYMWGVPQFIQPYGTPPHPYVAMYPHGAMYGHPAMTPGYYSVSPFAMPSPNGLAEASGNTPENIELDGKTSNEKGKLPVKRSKGSLGSLNMLNGNNEPGKASGASASGVSKSADSASERSSDGSDANSRNELSKKAIHRQDSAEPSQNGSGARSSQNGVSSAPHSMDNHAMSVMPMQAVAGVGPTTNLNIGMDYWATSRSSAVPVVHGKVSSSHVQGGMIPNGSRDSVQTQLWIQDEREIKKERRKQSNRESARRSRLRKQAECEELAKRAETYKEENASLRTEVARLRREYEQILAENSSLKEKLGEHPKKRRINHGDDHQNAGIDVEHSDGAESDQ